VCFKKIILSLLALLLITGSLIPAPFEIVYRDVKQNKTDDMGLRFAPIWASPYPGSFNQTHLRMDILAAEWSGILGIYVIVFFRFKTKRLR